MDFEKTNRANATNLTLTDLTIGFLVITLFSLIACFV